MPLLSADEMGMTEGSRESPSSHRYLCFCYMCDAAKQIDSPGYCPEAPAARPSSTFSNSRCCKMRVEPVEDVCSFKFARQQTSCALRDAVSCVAI
eukprot:scaffold193687_cov16-Prasinocladus_malaysianus.AAC.1